MGEHLLCKQGVRGSTPLTSTSLQIAQYQVDFVAFYSFALRSPSSMTEPKFQAGDRIKSALVAYLLDFVALFDGQVSGWSSSAEGIS